LLRMMTELIFVLLGGFLVWAGLRSGFLFNPRRPEWLLLAGVLVFWGARAVKKTTRYARSAERTAIRVGGASLILVGIIMFALGFVQFRWFGITLALAGGILVLRGLAGAALALRTD